MRYFCMVVLNVFLLLVEVNGQKKVKEVKYPLDGNIQKLDYNVTGFPTDTIDVLCLETGDLLKLNLVGYDAAGKSIPLAERGYKIQSFKMTAYMGWHILDYPNYGDLFGEKLMWRIYRTDHFYISDVILVDVKGKKSKLPLWKTFSVKGNCMPFYLEDSLQIGVYGQVTEEPKFPGGRAEYKRFIQKNLRFSNGGDEPWQTRATVKLIIDSTGQILRATVDGKGENSRLSSFESEILRVVRLMPNWIPGKCNGQRVVADVRIPVNVDFAEE